MLVRGAATGPTRRSPCKQRTLSPPGRQFGLSLNFGSCDLPTLQFPGAFAVCAASPQLLSNLTDASGNPSMLSESERGDPSFSPRSSPDTLMSGPRATASKASRDSEV